MAPLQDVWRLDMHPRRCLPTVHVGRHPVRATVKPLTLVERQTRERFNLLCGCNKRPAVNRVICRCGTVMLLCADCTRVADMVVGLVGRSRNPFRS